MLIFAFAVSVLLAEFDSIVAISCPAGNFQCKSEKKCVEFVKTCDGVKQCSDGSDELVNCTNGCEANGTLFESNSTIQTDEWWYKCARSRWILSGCVVHGVSYKIGQIFRAFTQGGSYWGKCEQIGPGVIIRQPQGCLGNKGVQITDGQTFLLNQAFWAKCIVRKNNSIVNGLNITLNDVSWKIVGCNNGSKTPVGEDVEFPWIFEPITLWGVSLKCHIPAVPNLAPVLTPLACLVGVNRTGVWEVRRLESDCYTVAEDFVYFCRIHETKNPPNVPIGQLKDFSRAKFNLNITENSPKVLKKLASEGYKSCYKIDKQLTSLVKKGSD